MTNPPVFDGHNDVLLELHLAEPGQRSFLQRGDEGHLDLPRARDGGFAGGFFAMFAPNPEHRDGIPDEDITRTDEGFEVRMAPTLDQTIALQDTLAMMSVAYGIEHDAQGAVQIVRNVPQLQRCLEDGVLAMILHIEGADCIDHDFHVLHVLYEAGLRSLGPVWSRPNDFGTGVPFKFPQSPDVGPGLSDLGFELIRRCNQLGIMVDLSHLNARGFWDVAERSDAPLVATHSAAHAISATARNLTDDQLDAIARSGGVVGVNFYVGDLRTDGRSDTTTPLSQLVTHIRYIVDRIGIEHVAFGSDFDGATMSDEMRDVTGLPRLLDLLREDGFTEDDLARLAYRNWLRLLQATWKA